MNSTGCQSLGLSTEKEADFYNNIIGVSLAISSSIFIGASFVINKKSVDNIAKRNRPDSQELQDEELINSPQTNESSLIEKADNIKIKKDHKLGFQFLKEPLWWLGILTMGFGEIANFSAYIFSPASLVTPLGALSVVVTCILSTYFLEEKMNVFAKMGIILAVLGSFFVVLNAPNQPAITDLKVVKCYFTQPAFLVYAGFILTSICVLTFFQERHFMIRIILSSFSGSLCVVFTKSVGAAVAQLTDQGIYSVIKEWFVYVLIFGLISSIMFQMVQVTKALDMADASTVMPIYYVTFTMSVLVAMNVLFREYENMEGAAGLSIFIGFGVLCCAVVLLQAFKPVEIYQFSEIKNYSKNGRREINNVKNANQEIDESRNNRYEGQLM
jgi:drug/metabolite transporter (DMT)-like permease